MYVGGTFTEVGNVPRRGLAHILASGGVDPTWNPDVEGTVSAIHLSDQTVYVGGQFKAIGGAVRNCFAALDHATGQVLPWDATPSPRCPPPIALVPINALLRV